MNKNTKRRQTELRRERLANKIARTNRTRFEAVANSPHRAAKNFNA